MLYGTMHLKAPAKCLETAQHIDSSDVRIPYNTTNWTVLMIAGLPPEQTPTACVGRCKRLQRAERRIRRCARQHLKNRQNRYGRAQKQETKCEEHIQYDFT